MRISKFGIKLTSDSGILQLMDDLGKALSGDKEMKMLGGGNPAHIPEMERLWRRRMSEILVNGSELEHMLGNYTTPQGDASFLKTAANFFRQNYGWNVTEKNITILNGGQTTFFFLLNMFAGKFSDESQKKILFPIVPEYIGYVDQGITDNMLVGKKPYIEYIDDHTFKYKINFEKLNVDKNIGAICVSRPTNPTGNVVTDEEIKKLRNLATENNIPLLIDNAYGLPFPNAIYVEAAPYWDEQVIFICSLSKIGLPSLRTSIVVASEEITRMLSGVNAIVSLSTGTVGQHIVEPLLKDRSLIKLSKEVIRPHYEKKAKKAIDYFHSVADKSLPYYLHKAEGAFFLWLWCKDLPITAMELYERLKKRGVLVVPGNYFFPGFTEKWKHATECIRITYSQDEKTVQEGLKIVAEEINTAYIV